MTETEVLRTFVGIPVTGPGYDTLLHTQDGLRRGIRDERVVRWERPQNLHLTVQFLGDTQRGSLDAIAEALARAARRVAPITASLGPPGTFGGAKPRVIFVGIAEGSEVLVSLQAAIARELEAVGFSADPRPYTPHITIGRVRRGRSLDVRKLDRVVSSLPPSTPGASFEVSSVVHYRSELSPTGATYFRLATLSLGSGDRLDQAS